MTNWGCEVYFVGERMVSNFGTVNATKVFIQEGEHRSPLDLAHEVKAFSLDFEWGYMGAGPAQLSIAMLRVALGCPKLTERFWRQFLFDVVSCLHGNNWAIEVESVRSYVAKYLEREDKERDYSPVDEAERLLGGKR